MSTDRYDLEVERLSAAADEATFRAGVARAWNRGDLLFAPASPDGRSQSPYGCLTQIRRTRDYHPARRFHAATPALTTAIRRDARLPIGPEGVTRELLEVFAEWQRFLDSELGRTQATG